jgi:hypothetical protein
VNSEQEKITERESELLPIIDGELVENAQPDKEKLSKVEERKIKPVTREKAHGSQIITLNYIVLPLIFLTITLLGGLRLSVETNAFVFLKPALICLVFAAVLLVLFFRAGLLRLDGWFSENFTTLKNISNAFVLFTLFTASVQIFNALLPEQGLPFWIMGLLFLWTLWNNLFSVFTAKRLLQSLGSMFGLAFVLKYLVLANLTAPQTGESWLRAIIENPTKEAFTYLLDLPKYSAGTGYVQFFTAVFYLLGLFLLPSAAPETKD